MAHSLISLGANLGNARLVMQHAGRMLIDRFGASNVELSRLYRTPAVGGPEGQDDFYNAVATIQSSCSAFELWQQLSSIEQALGRQRRHRWEARRIDLDILLHDRERHWTPTLKVPHPRMIMRTFVLEPACELALAWIEPVTGRTLSDLNRSLIDLRTAAFAESPRTPCLVVSERPDRTQAIASLATVDRFLFLTVDPLGRPHSDSQIVDCRYRLHQKIAEEVPLGSIQLLVFAGASPDPSIIHWEDYCRGWSEVLGMTGTIDFDPDLTAFRSIPKYMLGSDNPDWAAHELHAAMTAMTCPIEPTGAFFDE